MQEYLVCWGAGHGVKPSLVSTSPFAFVHRVGGNGEDRQLEIPSITGGIQAHSRKWGKSQQPGGDGDLGVTDAIFWLPSALSCRDVLQLIRSTGAARPATAVPTTFLSAGLGTTHCLSAGTAAELINGVFRWPQLLLC